MRDTELYDIVREVFQQDRTRNIVQRRAKGERDEHLC